MNRTLRRLAPVLAATAMVVAACGSDDDSSDEPGSADTAVPEATAPPDADGPSTTGEAGAGDDGAIASGALQVTAVDFSESVAVLTNTGDQPVDLSGHWVCNRPGYSELPATELDAGDSLEISMGVSEEGGEVAIYSSASFDSSDDLLAYVHWGSGGGRAPVADAAGLWAGPPADASSDGIELVGEPGSADGWA